jgi:hypothetical protein
MDVSLISPVAPYSLLNIQNGSKRLSTSSSEPFSYLDILYVMARISLKQQEYSKSYTIYKSVYQCIIDPSQNNLKTFSISPSQFFHEFIYVMILCQDYDNAWNLCNKLIAFHENDPILLLFMADIVLNLEKISISDAIQFLTKLCTHIAHLDAQTFNSFQDKTDILFKELLERKKLKVESLMHAQ